MAINLNKHREPLVAAWKDVLDDKSLTNWALFGYEGMTNDLKFISKGDGGLVELIEELNSGKIQYAFIKFDMPSGSLSKYVLINWQGEGAPTVRKGTCANHVKEVTQLFTGFHVTMHARTEDDLDEKIILEKLAKAGSSFNFKSAKPELHPAGPIGTAYKKVDPVQEINSKERDQFWLREEEEEKRRVETERRRKDEEKRKLEEEVRKQNELAAKIKQEEETRRPVRGSERSREAQLVIGSSVAAARTLFQRDVANNNSKPNSKVPEKPIRSSVVAQRINALTQQTSNHQQIAPCVQTAIKVENSLPAQNSVDANKTSPLKNIDKIKLSLETPSQIQHEPIIDPTIDLSPNAEVNSFSAIDVKETNATSYRNIDVGAAKTEAAISHEPMIKQNILENDMFDASYSSSNDNEDEDSDNKFSTIKRSPYSKGNVENGTTELSRQNTVIENVKYKEQNGTTLDDISPEGMDEEGVVYEDLDEDPGLTARALYDYQAADDSEITFDPGDIITHIEQIDAGWWQGLGPHGVFGLFPANYVELLPCYPH